MRKLVFLSNKFPVDSPVRLAATALGFEVSGFIPPGLYLNHSTMEVDIPALDDLMVEMDTLINPGLPLELDLEHNNIFDGTGPLSPFEYMHLKLNIISHVKNKHPNRLLLNWGDPNPRSRWAAKSARTLTCASESAYWKSRHTAGSWKWAAKERRMYADVYELPTVLYVAPVIWGVGSASNSLMNSARWGQVIDYVIERDAEMVEFWLNQGEDDGFSDAFVVNALQRLSIALR